MGHRANGAKWIEEICERDFDSMQTPIGDQKPCVRTSSAKADNAIFALGAQKTSRSYLSVTTANAPSIWLARTQYPSRERTMAPQNVVTPESRPLLAKIDAPKTSWFPPIFRVFFTSALCAVSFSFTQTSIIYAFRVMTCDEYYKTHAWTGVGDRCALPVIEADTANAVAIVTSTTMFFSQSLRDVTLVHSEVLTGSDHQRVCHWVVDQAVRCQSGHVPADGLGGDPEPDPDLRADYRRRNGYPHHPSELARTYGPSLIAGHAIYQHCGVGRRVSTLLERIYRSVG